MERQRRPRQIHTLYFAKRFTIVSCLATHETWLPCIGVPCGELIAANEGAESAGTVGVGVAVAVGFDGVHR